jgi:hypothetical protein
VRDRVTAWVSALLARVVNGGRYVSEFRPRSAGRQNPINLIKIAGDQSQPANRSQNGAVKENGVASFLVKFLAQLP